MKISLPATSFIVRLLLVLSALVLAATGGQLVYLYRFTQSPLSLFPGLLLIAGILLVCLWVVSWKMYHACLARPMSQLSDVIEHIEVSQTDMAVQFSDTQCHEVQGLARSTASMLRQMKSVRTRLREVSEKILQASDRSFSASKNQSSVLASQVTLSDEMTVAIRELVNTVHHISDDVNAVVDVANRTLQFAEQGEDSVMNVVKSMEDIRRSSQVSSDRIMALGKQSEHITEVVTTIDRIIEDTKLIAFNATIEAARAKDEGKGFGVVALEIKRLAEEVFESTEDIKELIHEIQEASHALVLATEEEMKTVHRGAQLAEEAGASLQQIFTMVKLTTESAQRIASATHQQEGTSQQVLQSVETVTHSMNTFSLEAKQLAATAAELNILAEGLGQIISAFGRASRRIEE